MKTTRTRTPAHRALPDVHAALAPRRGNDSWSPVALPDGRQAALQLLGLLAFIALLAAYIVIAQPGVSNDSIRSHLLPHHPGMQSPSAPRGNNLLSGLSLGEVNEN